MPGRCLLYYITDRAAFPGDESARRRRLLEKISEAASAGVEYIQLREKDLPTRDLESLAGEAVDVLRGRAHRRSDARELRTALLINSRADVALAVHADGVHLRAEDISPQAVRAVWQECGAGSVACENSPPNAIVAVSCHSSAEVAQAAANGATFAVFAPVFEKKDAPEVPPTGLAALAEACRPAVPVFALGGITLENAQECLDAGAAGIAAIRLFQENDIAAVVKRLRG